MWFSWYTLLQPSLPYVENYTEAKEKGIKFLKFRIWYLNTSIHIHLKLVSSNPLSSELVCTTGILFLAKENIETPSHVNSCKSFKSFIMVTLSLPWKKAFWELSLPLIMSTRSESEMVRVTSGLAGTVDMDYWDPSYYCAGLIVDLLSLSLLDPIGSQ